MSDTVLTIAVVVLAIALIWAALCQTPLIPETMKRFSWIAFVALATLGVGLVVMRWSSGPNPDKGSADDGEPLILDGPDEEDVEDAKGGLDRAKERADSAEDALDEIEEAEERERRDGDDSDAGSTFANRVRSVQK